MSGYGSRFHEWFSGSYYDLAIELSLVPSNARLAAAVAALWTAPRMQGPWLDKSYTRIVAAVLPELGDSRHHYGVLRVDDMGELPCAAWIVRGSHGGADWVSLGVPTQALVHHGLQQLVHEAPAAFLAPLGRALVEIGARIFTQAGFELGIIGEETSGRYSSASFAEKDLPVTGFLLPEPLWHHVESVSADAAIIAPGLKWIPPTPAGTIGGTMLLGRTQE